MPHSTDTEIDAWRTFLTDSYKRRDDAELIKKQATDLALTARVASNEIVPIVLSFRRISERNAMDGLIVRYLEALLETRCILPTDLLIGLLDGFSFDIKTFDNVRAVFPLPLFEETVFTLLRRYINDKLYPGSSWKLHGIVHSIVRWLNFITEHEVAQQFDMGALHTVSTLTQKMYDALALLAWTVFGHQHFRDVDFQPWWKNRRAQIVDELTKFDVNVLQFCHSQLSGHFQALTRVRPFLETGADGKPILTREHILTTPEPVPAMNTRGGLFVWLTSVLYTRPWLDDNSIRNHVLVRYRDDVQSAVLNLTIAAFDVLVNSTMGQGTPQLQKRAKSFICNRLPALLASLTTVMAPGVVDSCISMALVSIDLGPVTPLGSTSAETKEIVKKSKLEFLQACVVHGVVDETNAGAILTDQTFTPSKAHRYNKHTLYSQCMANMSKLDALAQELDSMTGNVDAIARCIAELIMTLCNNKDTMTLKTVCSILLRRLPLMDYVFQHVAPISLTLPVCHLLNDWTHDQDQTEFQPPYEEFAVMLLFLVAIVHSHNLSRADLGLHDRDEFVARVLFSSVGNIAASNLNEEQNKQLSSWIQGLYATDEHGETVGITDEVYSQCPPQAFYLLVPMLFEQTVLACKSKILTVSAMKGGLEFLLEPFLLPSLIGGLSWVAETQWTDIEDANVRLHVLEKLMKSSSSSQEVQTMHKAILTIVAKPLEASLQLLSRTRPEKKKDAAKLIDILKPLLSGQRVLGQSTQSQLTAWSSAEGGFSASIRTSIQDVLLWVNNGTSGSKYTPCIVWEAVKIIGPQRVLDAIVDEVQHQTSIGNVSSAIDICTGIICAPSPGAHLMQLGSYDVNNLSLLDHLRLVIEDLEALKRMPTKSGEALIRLFRNVQVQSSMSQLASQLDITSLSLPSQEVTDQVMQDLGLSTDVTLDAAAAAVMNSAIDGNFANDAFDLGADPTIDLSKGADMVAGAGLLDMNQAHDDLFSGLGMDLDGTGGLLDGTNLGEQNRTAPEDDIFGDLDMNFDDAFNF